eukprot:486446-Pyramimonas_sp.AAC.1
MSLRLPRSRQARCSARRQSRMALQRTVTPWRSLARDSPRSFGRPRANRALTSCPRWRMPTTSS